MKLKILIASLSLVVGISLAGLVARPTSSPEIQNRLYANAVRQTVLVNTKTGQGSAVILKRTNDKGQIRVFALTAEHVVKHYKTVQVKVIHRTEGRLAGESSYEARVLRADSALDVALLWINAPESAFSAAEFADSAPASVGAPVFAVGNFLGDAFPSSVSVGVLSQVGVSAGRWRCLDQISAPVFPGSSGGGLFNSEGKILGIVVARVDATLGLFVPLRAISAWAEDAGFQWVLRGNVCPPDKAGGWLVPLPPEPVLPPAPDSGCGS